MRFRAPMIQCDAEDGYCGGQTVDYYEQTASSVNGTLVTAARRAPGWRSTVMGEDYCPEHAALAEVGLTEKNGGPLMTAPPRCGHRSRIGTHCYRPAGHTGPHIAGFMDEETR